MASWLAVTVLLMLSYQKCAHTETFFLKEGKNNTSNLDLSPNLGISWRPLCVNEQPGFSSPDAESTLVWPCCQSFPSLSSRYEDKSTALAADTSCSKVRETANVCLQNEACETVQENPVLKEVQRLLEQSKSLNSVVLPAFLKKLRTLTVDFSKEVTESPLIIEAIVVILNNVAASALLINKDYMEDILFTADVLTREEAKVSWIFLNRNDKIMNNRTHKSSSSLLLQSLELLTRSLTDNPVNISTPLILLRKTAFIDDFSGDFESSVKVDIPESDRGWKTLTVLVFSSMDNVLPPRDEVNSSFNSINGNVALIQSSGEITNISIRFEVFDDKLQNPKCVFWNFNLLDGLGGWDDDGCFVVLRENKTISCSCNHLTSLSILMSAYSPNLFVLDLITYIGLGISIGSLVVTLIIVAIIFRYIRNNTRYIRYICLSNSTLSLLIANICFLLGAQISEEMENTKACIAITFFTHFFYLAMFFWMLGSALLLLYRTFVTFGCSSGVMIGLEFTLGYGGPLIIAVTTYAVTAPKEEYVRGYNICWLNWEESKALLAFVIPVIVIVFINLMILTVVLYKMFKARKTDGTNMVDSNSAVVFTKAVTILTSVFGINWIVGIGTIVFPTNKGIHIASTLLFSLQGIFLLIFGVLTDKWVHMTLRRCCYSNSATSTVRGEDSPKFKMDLIQNAQLNLALPDSALPDPALPDPALPDPALPDPALPDPVLPDPACQTLPV